jgi:hypothetical protein
MNTAVGRLRSYGKWENTFRTHQMQGIYAALVGTREVKRPAGRPEQRRDDNIRPKTGLYKYGVKVMVNSLGLVMHHM